MPNWCENELTVSYDETEAQDKLFEFIAKVEALENQSLLGSFVPMPEALTIVHKGHTTIDGTKVTHWAEDADNNPRLLTMKEQLAIRKTGYKDWYDWAIANWGTKWDCQFKIKDSDEYGCVLTFETAWEPPTRWFEQLKEQWPDLSFSLFYKEEGMRKAGWL